VEAAVRPDVEPSHRLVRAGGRRPRGRRLQRQRHPGGSPWRGRAQLSRGVVEHQAVPAQGGPERHAQRARAGGAVGGHGAAGGLHGLARRAGAGVLGARVHGELLPRVHGRDPAAVPDGAAVRGRGAAAGDRLPGVVGGQVPAGVPEPVQLRAGGPGPGPARALLRARPGGAHQPRRLQHRPAPRAQRLLHAGLHPVHARHLRAPARRRAAAGAGAAKAAAPGDRARAHAAVPQRGGHRARRAEGGVRGGGVGGGAGGGGVRGAGEHVRRGGGRARSGADQHGVPAPGRGGHPGAAAGPAGVRGQLLPGPGQGHGAQLPRVPHLAGGEHAAGPVPAGPPRAHGSHERPGQGLGVLHGGLPLQAGRPPRHEAIPPCPQEGTRAT
jgi:hypothetical protein